MPPRMLPDGLLEINTPGRPPLVLDRIFASLAWPQQQAGHFIAIGVKQDGRFRVLSETSGGLLELGEAALRAKSDYMMDSIMVDERDTVSTTGLRNLEGLCFVTPPDTHRRRVVDRRRRRVDFEDLRDSVAVIPAGREITGNYRGALERTRVLIMTHRIIVDENDTPTLAHDLTQPMNFVLESAPVRALVLATGSIQTGVSMEFPVDFSRTWYKNMPRS